MIEALQKRRKRACDMRVQQHRAYWVAETELTALAFSCHKNRLQTS